MKWGVRRTKEELKYNPSSIEASVNRKFSKTNLNSPAGFRISGISSHALNRIEFGDDHGNDRKVTAAQIIDAAINPIDIGPVIFDKYGRPSRLHVGNHATAAINPENGLIITVWQTGSKTRARIRRKKENVQ